MKNNTIPWQELSEALKGQLRTDAATQGQHGGGDSTHGWKKVCLVWHPVQSGTRQELAFPKRERNLSNHISVVDRHREQLCREKVFGDYLDGNVTEKLLDEISALLH